MRTILITIAMLMSCKYSISQNKIHMLKIKSVPLELSTPYKVNCDFFETAFDGQFNEKNIRVNADIILLCSLIENVVYVKSDNFIDTRVKIYVTFEKSTKKTIICLSSNHLITVNGKLIKENKKLVDLIKKIM